MYLSSTCMMYIYIILIVRISKIIIILTDDVYYSTTIDYNTDRRRIQSNIKR